ncbi:MAG TPA: hypothetical protein DHV48_02780 [Prolixibacteraceae bacterium]|nr:hypothetical protein [Prolixibacteraceae bacterium]
MFSKALKVSGYVYKTKYEGVILYRIDAFFSWTFYECHPKILATACPVYFFSVLQVRVNGL